MVGRGTGNYFNESLLGDNDPVVVPQSTFVLDGGVFQELHVRDEIVLPDLGIKGCTSMVPRVRGLVEI